MDSTRMNDEKTTQLTEPPLKPRLHLFPRMLPTVFLLLVSIICFCIPMQDVMNRIVLYCMASALMILAIVFAVMAIRGYVILKKEYDIVMEDSRIYRKHKAQRFVRQYAENMEKDEKLMEWLRENPAKDKLMECMEVAIRLKDFCAMEQHLAEMAEQEQQTGDEATDQ